MLRLSGASSTHGPGNGSAHPLLQCSSGLPHPPQDLLGRGSSRGASPPFAWPLPRIPSPAEPAAVEPRQECRAQAVARAGQWRRLRARGVGRGSAGDAGGAGGAGGARWLPALAGPWSGCWRLRCCSARTPGSSLSAARTRRAGASWPRW